MTQNDSGPFLSEWRDILDSTLDLNHLQILVSDLGEAYENIAGDTRLSKIQNFLQRLQRLSHFDELRKLILKDPKWQATRQAYLSTSLPFRERAQAEHLNPSNEPYRGLEAFDETHEAIFFGRDSLIHRTVAQVQQIAEQPTLTNFLAVVGASGSGKSSFVRAGIIPRLRKLGWHIFLMTPTADPLESLAHTLANEQQSKLDILQIQDELLADKRILHTYLFDFMTRFASNLDRQVLVLDQFEELFTLCEDPVKRERFIANLLYALELQQQNNFLVLLTLRADFYHHIAEFDGLRHLLQNQQVYIGSMTRHDLARVIVGPADIQGYTLQPGLVELILDDVGHEASNLPLLSHALFQTWQNREGAEGKLLTLSGYQRAGGVKGAITQTADSIYNQFSQGKKKIMRYIFERLTKLGDGAEDTRRHVRLEELIPVGSDAEPILSVLAHLAHHRLITMDRDAEHVKVYVSHEVLIREWAKLRDWLDQNRDGLRTLAILRQDSADWAKNGRQIEDLHRGTKLDRVAAWIQEKKPQLSHLEAEFFHASQDESARLRHKVEAERQLKFDLVKEKAESAIQREAAETALRVAAEAEAEAAQIREKAAQDERIQAVHRETIEKKLRIQAQDAEVRNRSQRNVAITFSIVFVLLSLSLIVGTVYTFGLYRRAQSLAAINQVQAIVSLATAQLPLNPTVTELEQARLLGVQGVRLSQELSTQGLEQAVDHTFIYSQMVSLHNLPKDQQLQGHGATIRDVAFSPDGTLLASAGHDHTIHLWDLKDRLAPPIILDDHSHHVHTVRFSPDGNTLISASADRTIRVWNLRDLNSRPIILEGHQDDVHAIAISPDGQTLVSASSDETLRLWQLDALEVEPRVLYGHNGRVLAIAISPDGRMVASGGSDQRVYVWSIDQPTASPTILQGHQNQINGIAFAPDGQTLASVSHDLTVRLWQVADLQAEPRILAGHTAVITAVAFAPDGRTLASADRDNAIRLWDIEHLDEERFSLLDGHTSRVNALAFAPDSQTLASASTDQTVRLWRLAAEPEEPAILADHSAPVTTLTISGDGRRLFSVSEDRSVRLWDLQNTPIASTRFADLDAEIWSADLSSDGKHLAVADSKGIVYLWDLQNPAAAPIQLLGHQDAVWSLSFTPDGESLASASSDETIRIWDIGDVQAMPTVLHGHTGNILAVTFSPDGRVLASGSADQTIRLWDWQDGGVELAVLDGHEQWVRSVAFSPDGATLASADSAQTVHLWDATQWDQAPQVIHGAGHAIAFAPDSKTLVSGNVDGIVQVWNMDAVQIKPTFLQGHNRAVTAVRFSPDGQFIISAGEDQTVRIWSTLDRLVRMSCQQVSRSFSLEEWRTYLPDRPYEETCPNYPPREPIPSS